MWLSQAPLQSAPCTSSAVALPPAQASIGWQGLIDDSSCVQENTTSEQLSSCLSSHQPQHSFRQRNNLIHGTAGSAFQGRLAQDLAVVRAWHAANLLQQHCVVSLKGLEDVMV
jgi:hypothetical protein